MDRCCPTARRLRTTSRALSGALASSAVLLCGAAGAAPARYEIHAITISGIGSGASGMEMMRLLMGGAQPAVNRSLSLSLSSFQAPPAAPQAEHFIPAGLGLGQALPLLAADTEGRIDPAELPDAAPPKGRLLIYRGCAGSAAADQPEVIEWANLLPDQRRLAKILASRPASTSNRPGSRAPLIGLWPNRVSSKTLPPTGSLVGEHRVESNYAPQIRFQVGSNHDFLAPLQLTSRFSGEAVDLSWQPVPTALGSQAMAFGSNHSGDEMVIWTSSTAPWSSSVVPSAMTAAKARSLIRDGVLMPPEQTRCTIGAAVMKQLGHGLVHLTAYGDTLQVAGPAAAPGLPPLWTMNLERESMSTAFLMEMGRGQDDSPADQPTQEAPRKRGGWGLIPGLF